MAPPNSCVDLRPQTPRRRPRRSDPMKHFVVGITTLGITACCLQSSQALRIPSATRLMTRSRIQPIDDNKTCFNNNNNNNNNRRDASALFMVQQTPQPRRPRRMLKKRVPKEGDRSRGRKRNRRSRHNEFSETSPIGTIVPGVIQDQLGFGSGGGGNTPSAVKPANSIVVSVTQELRPLVPSIRREAGEDYWIDPKDLEREQKRKEEQEKQRIAFLNRKGDEEISKEKLMTEVKAPYRQNWIGYFSLMVAVLSIITTQFPELLELPSIRFPDL